MKRKGKKAIEAALAGRPSVLIVEADPDAQWRLARMLTLKGHRVVGTVSGDGALALMAEWPVDVVLVADRLREDSGIEVARKLAANHPDVALVIMAQKESPQVRLAARLAGAAAVLSKPFKIEAFNQLLAGLRGSAGGLSLPAGTS